MPFLRLVPLALLAGAVSFAGDPPKKVTPKLPPGKDTTVIDGPVAADGYFDYETALNDRLRGKTTPDTNAVIGLLQAFGPKPDGSELHADFWTVLGVKPLPAGGDYFVRETAYFWEEYEREDRSGFHERMTRSVTNPWKATDEPKFAEWLKVNEKPLATAAEASRRTDYFHPYISRQRDGSTALIEGGMLPMGNVCRELAAVLSLRAMLRCGNGKFDDAWADILTVHRLGRLMSRGSVYETLTGYALVAIAHRAELAFLAAVKLTAKQALKCQADLLALPPWASYAEAVDRYDRFAYLDAVQTVPRTGKNDYFIDPELEDLPPERLPDMLDWERMMRTGNGYYDRIVAALRKPTRAARHTAAAISGEIEAKQSPDARRVGLWKQFVHAADPAKKRAFVSDRVATLTVGIFWMTGDRMMDSCDRAEQVSRNGALAFALAAHFADHKAYPAKLADLAPKYAAKLPDDVFSGKVLVYKLTAKGYLLYSVGVNGIDDGGQSYGDDPKGDDMAVRVPRK